MSSAIRESTPDIRELTKSGAKSERRNGGSGAGDLHHAREVKVGDGLALCDWALASCSMRMRPCRGFSACKKRSRC